MADCPANHVWLPEGKPLKLWIFNFQEFWNISLGHFHAVNMIWGISWATDMEVWKRLWLQHVFNRRILWVSVFQFLSSRIRLFYVRVWKMFPDLVTLWLFNIAMEHGPFIDGLSMNSMVIFHGKLFVITRWYFRYNCRKSSANNKLS